MPFEENLKEFAIGMDPSGREASFDYCFNYFQGFRDSGNISELANPTNLQVSCLQLGFFLASWGMYRGSAELLQKSARYLIPVIKVIAGTDNSVWEIDANSYTDANIKLLLQLAEEIRNVLDPARRSDTLLTKIMLGVFGSVPAFDANFVAACPSEGICATFGRKALREIGKFYDANKEAIEERLPSFHIVDFETGNLTARNYTRAKLIDMVLYITGEKLIALREPKRTVDT
jgi:hypothetical protein